MLTGFTRSDVLELRSLALTGNTSFVVYSLLQPPPIRWPAVIWSMLFASVNSFNIAKIMNEREGKVYLSPYEEEIYHEHFKPHGVTPKQFEKIMSAGESRIIKKGGVLLRQGEQITSLKLVVRGHTRANVMGRHLTAMGSARGNRHSMQGGNSGAWIGEMAFLQSLWDQDQESTKSLQKKFSKKISNSSDEDATLGSARGNVEGTIIRAGLPPSDEPHGTTIVAVEDIELVEWSFEDMQKLMKSSRYIQDSLTRAMTAAVVGKVVNFMVSRQSAIPKWSTFLDNWKNPSPKHRQDEERAESEEEEEEEVSRSLRNPPLATSASWLFTRGLQ